MKGDNSNHAEKCFYKDPAFEEEHDLPEGKEHEDGHTMSDRSQNGAELFAAHAQKRTHAASHAKETSKNTGIDGNWGERNNGDTDERVRRSLQIVASNTGLSVDEEIWDQGQQDEDEGTDNFSKENAGNAGTRNIPRQLFGWVSKNLALETSESCSRQSAEGDPGRGV